MTFPPASQRAVEPAISVIHKVISFAGKPSILYWSSVNVPGLHLQDDFQLDNLAL